MTRRRRRLLLDAAQDWARARGQTRLMGNFNLTAMQQAGVMTSGFDRAPYTDQIWGPPWLPDLLEQAGFAREFPMTTIEKRLDQPDALRPLSDADRAALLADGFTFAPVTRRTIAARLEDARAILNESFTSNPMFVPVSREEFAFQARDMKWVMDPRISVVMHHMGKPAGAIIAIPDLNPLLRATGSRLRASTPWHYLRFRANRTRALVIFQGVMPEFQGRSLNPLMLTRVLSAMRGAGYTTMGGTWIADQNRASLRQAEKIGAVPLHGLHLYSKDLT